jgi:hypothetical protein
MTERGNSIDLDYGNGLRLDMGVASAYTTEFLDGPEEHAVGRDHGGFEKEQGHAR